MLGQLQNPWYNSHYPHVSVTLTHLCIEVKVFCNCQVVKQDIMLGTQSQTLSDLNHVLGNFTPMNIRMSIGRGKETCSQIKDPQVHHENLVHLCKVQLPP